MNLEQPGIDHTALAVVDTVAITASNPLSSDLTYDVATIVSTQMVESSLNAFAVGDHGRSFGSMQILNGSALSPVENVMQGIEQIRISREVCKSHPFAAYMGGPKGCISPHLQGLSAYRERRIKHLAQNIDSYNPLKRTASK